MLWGFVEAARILHGVRMHSARDDPSLAVGASMRRQVAVKGKGSVRVSVRL